MKLNVFGMFATVVSLAACLCSGEAQGVTHTLDLRGDGPRLMGNMSGGESSLIRSTRLGRGSADVGDLAVGDELEVAFFDNVLLTLRLVEKTPRPLGGEAFLAEVAGNEGMATAVVLRGEEGLTIDVLDLAGAKVYSVSSVQDGVTVRELHAGQVQCGGELAAPVSLERNVGPSNAPRLLPALTLPANIDIMVVFDAAAASYVRTSGGDLQNFAEVSVQKMNTAIANTGLNAYYRFRLVKVHEVAGDARGDILNMLDSFSDTSSKFNGYKWSDIAKVRDTAGADIVCVLVDSGSDLGLTGLGYSFMPDNGSAFAPYAINGCLVRSVENAHTMTHEVGHNMGAGHPTEKIDPSIWGPQYHRYSAGYYFTGDDGVDYFTVMGYNYDTSGNAYVCAPFFSSPEYSYQGVPVGDATHDNTRTLRETFRITTAFRKEKYVEPDPPPAPVDPDPVDPTPTDPDPTDPDPTDPDPTDPTPADPDPTDPDPTDPTPTDPTPTDPDPTDPTPTDPTPADPDPTDPTDPEPTEPATDDPAPVVDADGPVPQTVASVYDGGVFDADGALVGTIKVTVGKPNARKGNVAAVKAVVQLGAKKTTVKASGAGGKVEIDPSAPTNVTLAGGLGGNLTIGEEGLSGEYGGYAISGARNLFTSKVASEAKDADALLADWLGAVNIVCEDGVATVTVNKKGKVRASFTHKSGGKVTTSGQVFIDDGVCRIPLFFSKNAELAFEVALQPDGSTVAVEGLGDGAKAGKPGTLASGSKFRIDTQDELWSSLPGTVLTEYLPDGMDISLSGAKWALPKAGKVTMKSGVLDLSKSGENPAALKLTFKAKDGSFKGSFNAYSENAGRLKANKVNVSGVLVNGAGSGTAVVKGYDPVAVAISAD